MEGRKQEPDRSQGVGSPAPIRGVSGESSEAAELARQIEEKATSHSREPDRPASERRRRQVWNRFLFLAALAAIVLIVPLFLVGRGGEAFEVSPDELLGTWVTDDSRYADRAITVRLEELTLDLGDGVTTVHQILSIRGELGPLHRAYEITYAGPEEDEVLEVLVYDDGYVRLRNPFDVRWRRAEN